MAVNAAQFNCPSPEPRFFWTFSASGCNKKLHMNSRENYIQGSLCPPPTHCFITINTRSSSLGCSGACGRHSATCWLGNNATLSFFIAFPEPHNHSLFCFLLFFKSCYPPMYLKLIVEMSHWVRFVLHFWPNL